MKSTRKEYPDRVIWTNEQGQRHREDGPAVERLNGDKWWYLNGKLHREDGPALEYSDGFKSWHLNDKCHRVDGPAIECTNGTKYWYLNDKKYSEQEYNDKLMNIRLRRLMKL